MYLIMRTESFAKLFFLMSFTGLVMYILLAFYTFHTTYSYDYDDYTLGPPKPFSFPNVGSPIPEDMKYILIWTTREFNENPLGEGQTPFVRNNCSYVNCFLTTDKNHLNQYHIDFDVVVIDIGVLRKSLWKNIMPAYRNPRQKYLFHSMKSADEMPVCNIRTDDFFNWTWTYKTHSDIWTPFIEVSDFNGRIVAPKEEVQWIRSSDRFIQPSLSSKKKAVAWMPKSCVTRTNRVAYVTQLKRALKEHSLELDMYGCRFNKCPGEGCMEVLERDYYYYLAIEGSNAEDFITDDVLNAYDHNTVPIVKGGADYKRFLPEGSYIDAGADSVQKLAAFIAYSIKEPLVIYQAFFQWKQNYKIQRMNHDKGLCQLCSMMNDQKKVIARSSYQRFRMWWYDKLKDRCYPKGAEELSAVISYVNDTLRGNKKVTYGKRYSI